MSNRSLLLGAASLAASLGLAAASASPAVADSRAPCFFISQWDGGWKASDPNTIYIRVNLKDVYRIDLSAGSQELLWPGPYHLISVVRGSSSICGPLDLQLALSDGRGFRQPLIAKDLVKLTPDQVAALPRKYRP